MTADQKPEPDKNMRSGDNSTKGMPAPDHTVIIEAPRELGCYRLTRMLGRGGMGEVWQAFDTHLERDVAIKLMRKELLSNEDATRRFAREARAVARLNHPNIVHVYAFGDEKGLTYFAMEMVEGETVSQRLKRIGKLPLNEALSIAMQAIEGLSYANARGIIHRDIKPSNLMFTEDARVKIADFGLAKMVEHDTQMTAAGTAMGSPNYMSPEQARGEEADHRSDIYALGISLYQMLCDALPFTAHSPLSVLLKQIQDPLPEPDDLKNLNNGEVMNVLKKMTDKSPGKRYQSYGELAAALAALQPEARYKGAHNVTASMPVANTPPPVSSPTGGVTGNNDEVAISKAIPPPPPPPPASIPQTPSDLKSAVVSSRDSQSTHSEGESPQRKNRLIPVLVALILLFIAISLAFYVFSLYGIGQTSSRQAAMVNPADEATVRPAADEAPAPTASPTTTPPTPTPSPAPAITTSSPTPDPDTGMQPINITAFVTPRPTPFPGIPTAITPAPRFTATPTATPRIYILGTTGAGPGEQVPTYLDNRGRIPHKSFPAGSEVTFISSNATMVTAKAPDGRVVYIHKKMLSQKQ